MDTTLLIVGAIVIIGVFYLAFKPKKKQDKDTGAVPPIDEIIKMKLPKIGSIFGSNPPPTDKD